MESDTGYGTSFKPSQIVTNLFHRVTKKKRKTAKKVDEILMLMLVCTLTVECYQPEVLPEYQGPKLKGVRVETDIFEGMKFGETFFPSHLKAFRFSILSVVMSDPKSRTGEQDKKNLMTLFVV